LKVNSNDIDIWRELEGLKKTDLLCYIDYCNYDININYDDRVSVWIVTRIVNERTGFYALGSFNKKEKVDECFFSGLDFEAFRRIK